MKTPLAIILGLTLTLSAFGQGTQQRSVVTTSAYSRAALTNETEAGWLSWLGIPVGVTNFGSFTNFLGVVTVTPPANTLSISASTNKFFPLPFVLADGTYLVGCSLAVAATNTFIGFGETNGNTTIGTTYGTNFFDGTLTVSDPSAVYGFFVTQSNYDSNSIPILSSNSVAWLYRVK
jgi:hypothetical protein